MYERLLIAVTALALAAGAGRAASVDQSYLPSPNFGGAGNIDNSLPARGQSFTVGIDGFLTGVRVNISDKGNFDNFPDATLTVSIFDGPENDKIDVSGDPLASGTVGRTLGSTSFNDFKLTEVLFGSAIPVSVGDVLAIVLSGVDAGQNDGFWWARGGDFALYDGGEPFRTINGELVQSEVADYQFETLVSQTSTPTPIPVPAALPLLLGGMGALGLLRRRRLSG